MERERKQCKPKRWRTAWLACMATAALVLLPLLAPGSGFAQEGTATPEGLASTPASDVAAQAQATLEYWTPERMRQAIPMPMPSVAPSGDDVVREGSLPADAIPTLIPGWPGKGPQPGPDARIEICADDPGFNQIMGYELPQTSPPFIDPPANPLDFINYAPFNRWTWCANYLAFPTSTIGKLFFVQNGGNYVCSGSVIAKNTIATAGHCVSDGAFHWSTNLLFCPSYYRGAGAGAPHPSRGCWAWNGLSIVPTVWHENANIDYDHACFVTNTTGTVINDNIGDVTGWLGRAYNFTRRQSTFAWGYPSAAPFPGYHIIATASTEWYESDRVAGGQVSKYIGSDQTGGCSGGPWWIGQRHENLAFEYADTDGSWITDPGQGGGPYINGLNSHKRCNAAGCPPGSIFTQEQGSPPFLDTAAGDDAASTHAACLANGGS